MQKFEFIATTLSKEDFAQIAEKFHKNYVKSGVYESLENIENEHGADSYLLCNFTTHFELNQWIIERFLEDVDCPKKFYEGDDDYTDSENDFNGFRYYLSDELLEDMEEYISKNMKYSEKRNDCEMSTDQDWEDSYYLIEEIHNAVEHGYYICYYSKF